MNKKVGLKTFAKLITPSLLESLSVLVLFIVFFITDEIHQLYSKDLTSLSVATFKGTFLSGLAHWFSSLYYSKEFSTVAIYIFWFLIAFLVYVMASRFSGSAEEIVEDIHIRHYLWPRDTNRNNPIKEYIEKFGMRFIVLVTLCLYLLKLTPALVNWWRLHYIVASISLHSLGIYLALLILMTLYVHGLVILIRALLLRLRIVSL